jgi:hypothetical protein|tara:strand:- start:10 stop:354 length:345 start_codon:yes stop_codon:yes gene_type:complete
MDNQAIASELLKVAKSLVAKAEITERIYDSLRKGKRIVMNISGGMIGPSEIEFEVGRTSYSKKYNVYSKTIYPVGQDGKPYTKGVKWTLFKRESGAVSLASGDMGVTIKSFRIA